MIRAVSAGGVLLVLALLVAGTGTVAADLQRSGDDQGFSILLISPTEAYLVGRQAIRIDPIIPRGDAIQQVDFFIDGRLVSTDRSAPYAFDADFGDDIRRHTIEVRALTRLGRRAKVSLISRSGDVGEGAVGRVETLAVLVRDGSGHPVDRLSVSDFTLLEEGRPQPIVHIESREAPGSLVIVPGAPEAIAPGTVAIRTARLAGELPRHLAVSVLDGAPFSYDLPATAERLRSLPATTFSADTLAARLSAAAAALTPRRGPHSLLLLLPGAPAEPVAAEGGATEATAAAAAAPAAIARKPPLPPPAPDALDGALAALHAARAALYVVVAGGEAIGPLAARLRPEVEASGGSLIHAADSQAVDKALQAAVECLRDRYLLSYLPPEPERAGWRPVEVRVRGAGLQIQAPRRLYIP